MNHNKFTSVYTTATQIIYEIGKSDHYLTSPTRFYSIKLPAAPRAILASRTTSLKESDITKSAAEKDSASRLGTRLIIRNSAPGED